MAELCRGHRSRGRPPPVRPVVGRRRLAVVALASGLWATTDSAALAVEDGGGWARLEDGSRRPAQAGRILRGRATYYADSFEGRPTASGEPYDPQELTAAHRSLPFGARVRVTNRLNGLSVGVRINDRGPFGPRGRIIDLSRRAAEAIDMIEAGVVPVEVEILSVPEPD